MRSNEGADGVGRRIHDNHGDDHGCNHHLKVFGHADRGEDRIQGKHQIDGNELNHDRDKACIQRLSISPTLTKYKAITTSPPEIQAGGARSFKTAVSASTDHTITTARFNARSRTTRTGWRNLNGTKVSTARQATIVAATDGTGLSRNR